MPMAIEVGRRTRRGWIAAVGGICLTAIAGSAGAAPGSREMHRVAAAWDDAAGRHHVGILAVGQDARIGVETSIEVPTRAHGLLMESGGSVLVVARRPGDWLLRWHPHRQKKEQFEAAQWHWLDGDSRFNGHVVAAADGGSLWSTETDQESGQGVLVRRDVRSLAAIASWPTQGLDPHAMLCLPDGTLLVANGGIGAQSETGRSRLRDAPVDSSLVQMAPENGAVLRRWRLDDSQLSLRHLARHAGGTVAVALQAQHDDPEARARAPVLGLLDLQQSSWTLVEAGNRAGGYGGDVAVVGEHCYVSCPRGDKVLRVSLDGKRVSDIALPDACALAGAHDATWLWASGKGAAWQPDHGPTPMPLGLTPDNHAVVL